MVSKSARHRLEWASIAIVAVLVAWLSLHRLQHEKLFLIRLPWDRAPLTFELHDAAVPRMDVDVAGSHLSGGSRDGDRGQRAASDQSPQPVNCGSGYEI